MKTGSGVANSFQGGAQAPASGTQRITGTRRTTRAAKTIFGYLAVYVGPVTAQSALNACCRSIARELETLDLQDVPQLLAALRPMLATLLGGASCRILLRRIERDLSES